MSKPQYKKIAFPHGGIVPAAFSRSEKDERVGPHHAVDAETTYAQTLVDDRFAYFWSKKTAEAHQPADHGSLLVEDANGHSWWVSEPGMRLLFANPQARVGQRAGLIVVPVGVDEACS